MPSRPLWRQRGGEDDAQAAAHNGQTFELLREFIRAHGSIAPGAHGKTLAADTIADYVGALREALDAALAGPLANDNDAVRRKRLQRSYVTEDGPKRHDRSIRRLAFRAQHFRRAAASPFDRLSVHGQYRWTVALTMWQCLLRPGEPGKGKGASPFDPKRGLTLADVVWWPATITDNGRPAVVLMIVPIKDSTGRAQRHPIVVSALHPTDQSDPMCTYSHLVRQWHRRTAAVCQRRPPCTCQPFCVGCASSALFASPVDGEVWKSADANGLVKDLAGAIGENPEEFAGYCMRIGGATDLAESLGLAEGERVTKQRGRWWSDIFFIYQRSTANEQMDASVRMLEAGGHTFESLLPGWVQPTRSWSGRSHR